MGRKDLMTDIYEHGDDISGVLKGDNLTNWVPIFLRKALYHVASIFTLGGSIYLYLIYLLHGAGYSLKSW
jgi:hypothetical protein